jgi:hypothetical protein
MVRGTFYCNLLFFFFAIFFMASQYWTSILEENFQPLKQSREMLDTQGARLAIKCHFLVQRNFIGLFGGFQSLGIFPT